ncbi:unnamed protein product [Rotaria sp. Silwood1]|nr:unnamed protein product [Rotaria sp. Silwood1]
MATKPNDTTGTKNYSRLSDVLKEPHCWLLPIEGYEMMPLVSLETAVESLVGIVPDIRPQPNHPQHRAQPNHSQHPVQPDHPQHRAQPNHLQHQAQPNHLQHQAQPNHPQYQAQLDHLQHRSQTMSRLLCQLAENMVKITLK